MPRPRVDLTELAAILAEAGVRADAVDRVIAGLRRRGYQFDPDAFRRNAQVASLISDAADAVETFGENELEACARSHAPK